MSKLVDRAAAVLLGLSGIGIFCTGAPVQEDEATELVEAYLAARMEIWGGELQVAYRRWSQVHDERGTMSVAFEKTQNSVFFSHQDERDTVRLVDDGVSRFLYFGPPSTFKRASEGPYRVGGRMAPFDCCTVGLVNRGEWDRRFTLETMQNFLRDPSHHVEIRNHADNCLRVIRWRAENPMLGSRRWMREVTVDLTRGFVPTSIHAANAAASSPLGNVIPLKKV